MKKYSTQERLASGRVLAKQGPEFKLHATTHTKKDIIKCKKIFHMQTQYLQKVATINISGYIVFYFYSFNKLANVICYQVIGKNYDWTNLKSHVIKYSYVNVFIYYIIHLMRSLCSI
jgi:hypothetical protein